MSTGGQRWAAAFPRGWGWQGASEARVLEQRKLVYRKVNNTDRVMRREVFGSCYEWEAWGEWQMSKEDFYEVFCGLWHVILTSPSVSFKENMVDLRMASTLDGWAQRASRWWWEVRRTRGLDSSPVRWHPYHSSYLSFLSFLLEYALARFMHFKSFLFNYLIFSYVLLANIIIFTFVL